MNIKIPKSAHNLVTSMRRAGYHPDRHQPKTNEQSFSRSLQGAGYPKFHVYAEDGGDAWILKLHLDQKRPSYEGSAAHSGEYDGPLVEQELERIRHSMA